MKRVWKIAVLAVLLSIALLPAAASAVEEDKSITEDLFNLLVRSATELHNMFVKFIEFRQVKDAVDYLEPETRNFFLRLIPHRHSGSYNIAQICDIWDYCYSRWTYVSDPDQHEYIASASESIANGFHGDCEDFAVLIAAGIKAIGGTAWILMATQGDVGHAYAQVYLGSKDYMDRKITPYLVSRYRGIPGAWYTSVPDYGVWLNLDYTAANPGGPFLLKNGTVNLMIPFWGTALEPSLKSPNYTCP